MKNEQMTNDKPALGNAEGAAKDQQIT